MQRLGSSTNGLLDKLVEIDGNFAVVGEPGVNGARGMARVYRRSTAGVWTHQFTLTANDGEAGDKFGFSVAIDGLPITVAHHRCPSRSP
ncbi:MAG: hypothetical protein GY703_11730 [Gammaproteobacteria bacterium]|nr:hypothetical protein [Gammaproteobacteria bacterium]